MDEPRRQLRVLGCHDVGRCPTCGFSYDVACGLDRLEVRLACDCPAGAPDSVIGYAMTVSAGLETFPPDGEPLDDPLA